MTDARPPWQRGRRRTEEERRSHWSRISSASEIVGDRSESGSHVEWKRDRRKKRKRERDTERKKESTTRGDRREKKANVLAQQPYRLPRSRMDPSATYTSTDESGRSSSRSYLIDDHPRDAGGDAKRRTRCLRCVWGTGGTRLPRRACASRNGFRKLDALQSVARASRLAVSTGHVEPIGQVRALWIPLLKPAEPRRGGTSRGASGRQKPFLRERSVRSILTSILVGP